MNCAEFEISLADYVDDTLGPAERTAIDQHASSCRRCQELLADVLGAVSVLSRAGEVTPPPELITRIAYAAPIGRIREPLERQGFLSRLTSRFLQPLLQPRLAMSMAMTVVFLGRQVVGRGKERGLLGVLFLLLGFRDGCDQV